MASYPFIPWLKRSQGFGLTGTGPPPTDDLTPPTRDSVFAAQLEKAEPTALDAEKTHHYAHSVHSSLLSANILTPTGQPNTSAIDRNLVSHIAIISVPKCRELVNMLFWWEEELTRWRLLDEEIKEAESVDGKGEGERERVEVLKARKRVLPSLRESDGRVKLEGAAPPEYKA